MRQAREDRLVNVVVAEYRLVLPKAQAPQPDHDVHDGAQSGLRPIIMRSGESVQEAEIGGFSVNQYRHRKQCHSEGIGITLEGLPSPEETHLEIGLRIGFYALAIRDARLTGRCFGTRRGKVTLHDCR